MQAMLGQDIAQWNDLVPVLSQAATRVSVHDETLRDGLQSPSVRQPRLDQKLALLARMDRLGLDSADIGMPVSNDRVRRDVATLVAEAASNRMRIALSCAARSTSADVTAVASVVQDAGIAVRAMIFIGTSSLRGQAEQWTAAEMTKKVHDAVDLARREGMPVCVVTEDTTRSPLDTVLDVYTAGLDAGAERVCICDTVGYATPWSTTGIVTCIRRGLARRGFPAAAIEWHGHNDRGLSIANSLSALAAGADCVHGTALGVGERAGNTPLEQLLPNLADLGWRPGDCTALPEYCAAAADACGITVPANQPFVGADAFRTATGVHAAAIRKAALRGDTWLAERVYSGIPASAVGREQTIEVGPGSGKANVLHWLVEHDIAPSPPLVQAIMRAAAATNRVLPERELYAMAASQAADGG